MSKENDMNEARASERADLVAKPYAWLFEPHPVRLFFEAPRDPSGWLALYTEDDLRAELSRVSATAHTYEAQTVAGAMADFEGHLNSILNASSAIQKEGVKPFCEARTKIRAFVQRLAERAVPSQEPAATASHPANDPPCPKCKIPWSCCDCEPNPATASRTVSEQDSSRLTKSAYEQLVQQDVWWLLAMPDTLERRHILDVLKDSVRWYYPAPSVAEPATGTSAD